MSDVHSHELISQTEERTLLRDVARRIFATLLLGVCCLILLLAGVASTASSIGGSGSSVADTVLAVAINPDVREAVATKLVDQIQSDTDASTSRIITARKAQFIRALESVIGQSATQRLARQDLVNLYNATSSQKPYVLNLRPLLYQFTRAMHAIDPQISAQPKGLQHSEVTIKGRKTPLHLAKSLFLAELVLFILGAGILTLTTRFLIRNRRVQYWAWVLTFGLPGVLLIALGIAAQSVAGDLNLSDASAKVIARQAGQHLSTDVIESGVVLVLMGGVALLIWTLTRKWRSPRMATSTESSA